MTKSESDVCHIVFLICDYPLCLDFHVFFFFNSEITAAIRTKLGSVHFSKSSEFIHHYKGCAQDFQNFSIS